MLSHYDKGSGVSVQGFKGAVLGSLLAWDLRVEGLRGYLGDPKP